MLFVYDPDGTPIESSNFPATRRPPCRCGEPSAAGLRPHRPSPILTSMGVDVSVKLTVREARRLAANLIEAAQLIGTDS